jgi:hypothetical protein
VAAVAATIVQMNVATTAKGFGGFCVFAGLCNKGIGARESTHMSELKDAHGQLPVLLRKNYAT